MKTFFDVQKKNKKCFRLFFPNVFLKNFTLIIIFTFFRKMATITKIAKVRHAAGALKFNTPLIDVEEIGDVVVCK